MKKILTAGLLFIAQIIFVFGQGQGNGGAGGTTPGSQPPPPNGGAGGTTPGHRVVDIDMYIPLLIMVAIVLIGVYMYNRKRLAK